MLINRTIFDEYLSWEKISVTKKKQQKILQGNDFIRWKFYLNLNLNYSFHWKIFCFKSQLFQYWMKLSVVLNDLWMRIKSRVWNVRLLKKIQNILLAESMMENIFCGYSLVKNIPLQTFWIKLLKIFCYRIPIKQWFQYTP